VFLNHPHQFSTKNHPANISASPPAPYPIGIRISPRWGYRSDLKGAIWDYFWLFKELRYIFQQDSPDWGFSGFKSINSLQQKTLLKMKN